MATRKYTLCLTDEMLSDLKRIQSKTGATVSVLIRRAVDKLLKEQDMS